MGSVTPSELSMQVYEQDSSAVAVLLHNEKNKFFSDTKRKLYTTDYYKKIKVLTKEGLEYGTFKLRFGMYTKVNFIRGICYNLEQDGTITKNELTDDNFIISKDEYYTSYIVNFSNVKVGSVIEFRYSFTNRSFNLSDWYFQSKIPVKKSEIKLLKPTKVQFLVNLIGQRPLSKKERIDKVLCTPGIDASERCNYTQYTMENIPAYKEEVLAPHPSLLISKLDFKMQNYFGSRSFNGDWNNFDKIKLRSFVKDQKSNIKMFGKTLPDSVVVAGDKLATAKNVFYLIQDRYKWNGSTALDKGYSTKKKSKQQEVSNTLLSIALYSSLQSVGIDCDYVAVSTNSLGPIDFSYADAGDFNFTIIKATIDGKSYFLDPTNKELGFGYVQPFASTKRVRVLKKDAGYWDDITMPRPATKSTSVKMQYEPDTGFTGTLIVKSDGYSGMIARTEIADLGLKRYTEELEDALQNFGIVSERIQHIDDKEKSLTASFEFELEDDVDSFDGVLNPMLFQPVDENPFTKQRRDHPVDYVYPRFFNYRFELKIPKGYTLKKVPENKRFQLQNKGMNYLFMAKFEKDTLQIFTSLKILKTYYSTAEYSDIKNLHDKIVQHEKNTIEIVKIPQ